MTLMQMVNICSFFIFEKIKAPSRKNFEHKCTKKEVFVHFCPRRYLLVEHKQ